MHSSLSNRSKQTDAFDTRIPRGLDHHGHFLKLGPRIRAHEADFLGARFEDLE
jgi:hypothetical protein